VHPSSRTAVLVFSVCALIGARASAADIAIADVPMGRCVGSQPAAEPPSDGGPAVDFRAIKNATEYLPALTSLGFKTDERTGTVSDPQGRAVTQAYLARLLAPVDLSQERIPMALWSALVTSGYRLDETTCRLALPSQPPVTRIELMITRREAALDLQKMAVESLKVKLEGLSASAPVPDSLRRQMDAMQGAGVELPPELLKAMKTPGATVGSLSRSADAAYLQQTRFFDGQRGLGNLTESALPKEWTPGKAAGAPSGIQPEERRLGDMFAADIASRFAQNGPGRELLGRFTAKDGSVHLPPILLLKAQQRPDDPTEYGAYYDPSHDTLTLNHWAVERDLLNQLPEKERARVGQSFSDPRALRLYLEQHPKERAAILGVIDEVLYHELIHAWQDRRDRLDVEMLRGNAPGYNPLAKEHEAWREQCRYDFDKAGRDPSALTRSGYAPYCLLMLKDYDSFRDAISRIYMGGFAGSQELGDVARIQAARESTAKRLMGDGLYQSAVETLKLVGMWHGDEALKQARTDYDKRQSDFVYTTLPQIRVQALTALAPRYEQAENFYWAYLVLSNLRFDTPGLDGAVRRWAAAAAPALVKTPKDDAANVESLSELAFAIGAAKIAVTPAIRDAYLRDVRSYVSMQLKTAAAAPSAQRAGPLAQAASWIAVLPKDDPLRARVAAAEKGAPR
jgi:hypothetical protein